MVIVHVRSAVILQAMSNMDWCKDNKAQTVCILHGLASLISPGQNGRHFADGISKCIFMNEKLCISIRFSLKFVPWCPIDSKSVLVQVIAWHRAGDKQLSEPMLTQFFDAYMWR